jgi:membrane-associated protease RseP (regulator of RpoE activity)
MVKRWAELAAPRAQFGLQDLTYAVFLGQGDESLGMTLSEASAAIRSQLALPEGQGVVVASVAGGGPADQVGLKVNDILLTLGDQPIGKPEDLTKHLKAVGEKEVELKVLRDGKAESLKVRPVYHVTLAPPVTKTPSFYIGVQTSDIDPVLRAHLNLPKEGGLMVDDVVADSPAKKAGVQQGDVLVTYNTKPIASVTELSQVIQEAGEKPAAIELIRQGKTTTIEVAATLRMEDPASGPDMNSRYNAVFASQIATAPTALRYYAPARVTGSSPLLTTHGFALSSANATPPSATGEASEIGRLTKQVEELKRAIEELKQQVGRPEGGTSR